jgi:DNA-directed RNA polymerase I, II, and III subunit RPABC3
MTDAQLLEETFTITDVNNEKYDRVSRISGTSSDVSMQLDINHELFPVSAGDQLTMVLATTLNLDGTKDEGKGWRETAKGESTLADMYDYVCYGKVYKVEDGEKGESV